jgi:hypothetical protein
VRVLSWLFRRLFLQGLSRAHAAGRLGFFGTQAHWLAGGVQRLPGRAAADPVGSLRQAPAPWARGGAGSSMLNL